MKFLAEAFPQYSFNLIAGAPGTGKTTLSQQVMFVLAFTDLRFSADLISFLSDDVIFQRYVEIEGRSTK